MPPVDGALETRMTLPLTAAPVGEPVVMPRDAAWCLAGARRALFDWAEAVASRDVPRVLALYAEDAILVPEQASGFNNKARAALSWTASRLELPELNQIRSMPTWYHLDSDIVCVHDSPVPQDGHGYIRSRTDATPVLHAMDHRICLFGHTHLPAIFTVDPARRNVRATRLLPRTGELVRLDRGGRYLLNPGSVGQPRDGDWRASWGLLDLEAMNFSTHRSAYEVSSVRHAIACAGLPSSLGERLLIGA